MKTLLLIASFALVLPFAACTETTTESTTCTNPFTGSVTHQDTTVRQYPNGTTTVDQTKTTTP